MKKWSVRKSQLHGKGAFAKETIYTGELIGEYKGKILPPNSNDPVLLDDTGHTFLFSLSNGSVIDGGRNGNGTRFINHSCSPNCQASEEDLKILIHAISDIEAGEELFIDYMLTLEQDDDKGHHVCKCGSPKCRGTMILKN